MNKSEISELIRRLNIYERGMISTQTTCHKARLEAEKLADKSIYPVLQEIISENEGKEQKNAEARFGAYVIYGCLLLNAFDRDACAYYIGRLAKEKNRDLLCIILGDIRDLADKAKIAVPEDIDVSPLISLATGKIKYLNCWAISALAACPRQQSRDVLRGYLKEEDEKAHKDEICNSIIALQTIGEREDVPLLERFLKSRRPDLKSTSAYAIKAINDRNNHM